MDWRWKISFEDTILHNQPSVVTNTAMVNTGSTHTKSNFRKFCLVLDLNGETFGLISFISDN